MTYHFYLFVGKFPKLLNFSDVKEKSYVVELNIFKENAFYGLQKILLDNFPWSFYAWSTIVNGTCMQKIKIGHRAKFRAKSKCRRFYFRFARFYTAFNFQWAYFDSFSWRVLLAVDCARVQRKNLSSLLKQRRPQQRQRQHRLKKKRLNLQLTGIS